MVRSALILFILCVPFVAGAQVVPFLETTLDVEVIPRSPQPNEVIALRAVNVGSAGGSTFVWRVNGAIVEQGVGRDAITTQVGGSGSAMTVSVSVSEGGIEKGSKTITVRPAGVDIVWEGKTYTPPFYGGRPLPNGSSLITVTAIPAVTDGASRVGADDLVYEWFINSSRSPLHSGYGLRTITIRPPQFENEFEVSVSAQTQSGSVRAENSTLIRPAQPGIVIYEKAPLIGHRFDRAHERSVELAGKDELTLSAFPLFVDNVASPTYRWNVDGEHISDTGFGARELTLRRSGEGAGEARVVFSFESAGSLFERAQKILLLTF